MKRLISYSLKSFKLNYKNVEFSRSTDFNFFRFTALLILKLIFKFEDGVLKNAYFKNGINSISDRYSFLIFNFLNFLLSRNRKEDLVVRKSTSAIKFFLRLFCLTFYQIPLYNYLISDLKGNLARVLNVNPTLVVLGCENKNVTSAFISRFLSRKLAQKYR